ncbi:hypothetical protein ISG33_10300 [Glaciecola sp. MH2013]|uniref:DUF6436 domain-containing protein n=1 Tax=Glaciecola sp. MH2013 TaxID=2785524 RepID=UPI00189DD7A2|nr:DUF6436 domain-containing protein [Glaciecola sp. MH2013]MBF7073788.1 hypothetical protein [Glaciecola sp. MH2013]
MPKYLLVLIALLWGAFALIAVKWVGSSKFVDFDPNLKLSSAIMSLSFETDIVQYLPQLPSNSKGHVYHIVQGACFCETLSEGHKSALNTWADANGLTQQSLNINEFDELKTLIPSTPAVIVVTASKELVYLGPYSEGYGCFENVGLVDAKIQPVFDTQARLESSTTNTAQDSYNFPKRRSQIQSEARGCYCKVK